VVDWLNTPETPSTTTPAPPLAGERSDNWLTAPEPTETTPSPSPAGGELGWRDVPGALTAGVRQSISDVGETFGQHPSTGVTHHPAAAPFALSDITHPGSAAAKLAHRIGSGSPTIAGGITGGVGGEALAGPPGGIAGGALGAAAGSALQTLGPVFQHELAASPDDPDGAWNRALKSAAASGAFSGAAWAIFPAKFFEGPLKNAAFQIFGVQPGLAVGHQATENIMHGEAPLQGAGEAYTEGAIGTALPMAGAKAVGAIGALGKGTTAAQVLAKKQGRYTANDLFDVSREHYADVKGLNITYPHQNELVRLRDQIHDDLYKAEGDARDQPNVFSAVDDLTQSRRPNATVDFADIEHARGRLNGQLSSTDANTRRVARVAINALDDWLGDHQAQIRAGVAPDIADVVAQKMKQARAYWRAGKGMEAWDRVQARIDDAPNPETKRRAEIYRIVHNPRLHWQYPPEAIDLMRASLQKGFLNKVNEFTQWFSPHSATGLITDFMLHHFTGPMGLVAPVGSEVLRRHVQKPLEHTAEGVRHIIRHAPTGNIPAPLGVSGRTAQGYTPFAGPIAPQPQQQYAEGGTADMPVSPPSMKDRLYIFGHQQAGNIIDQREDNTPAKNYLDDPAERSYWNNHPDKMSRDAGYWDIGRQDGGEVGGDTPFDDPMFKQALEAQGPEQRQSREEILRKTMTPSYFRDTPSSPEADAVLANPFAPAGKIGPPSGAPTTVEKMGGFAADMASSLIPGGKAAAALKGMFLPAPIYAAERAEKMLKLGSTMKDIWDQYGIFKDAAGHWRTEVSGPTRDVMKLPEAYKGKPIKSTLAGVVDMPHLYKEAPFMARAPMTIAHPEGAPESTLGSYDPNTRQFWVRPENRIQYPARNTIWHELQHAIDHPAGLLEHPGGDPEWYEKGMKGVSVDDPIYQVFEQELQKLGHTPTRPMSDPKLPGVRKPFGISSEHLAAARGAAEYQRYRRSVSEVMARNAERREEKYMDVRDRQGDEAARRWLQEHPPETTEDYPRELQIIGGRKVRKHGGKVERALACARRVA
jgi:hypothetical protein